MTSPGFLANMRTAVQREAERSRLEAARRTADQQLTTARHRLRDANNALDRARAHLSKSDKYLALYPPGTERQEDREHQAQQLPKLVRRSGYAAALAAAAAVVSESAHLELAWQDRPVRKEPGAALADVVGDRLDTVVNAPGYRVTVHPQGDVLWSKTERGLVRRSRARSIVSAWFTNPHARVLQDVEGRLFIVQLLSVIELVPTDIAPPRTEADALRAALATYGFPAVQDGEGGMTWLSAPLNPLTPEDDVHSGLHYRVNAGEQVDRVASAHAERFSVALYDEESDYVDSFYGSRDGMALAEACAHTARAIAEDSAQHPSRR
ncbi:hypothetical protein KUF83_30185 [Streptomyces sp. BV286]|uniref:hypothetical protein n=1 Tax=Streptomyces sp. BV286 TaxID=2849672 RepID=UPI001C2EC3B4|nr:hypothetical protein [Streptomyces sp. BV286]MBV1940806.1 hypothetical protein [Streptomyces sp. BV286]